MPTLFREAWRNAFEEGMLPEDGSSRLSRRPHRDLWSFGEGGREFNPPPKPQGCLDPCIKARGLKLMEQNGAIAAIRAKAILKAEQARSEDKRSPIFEDWNKAGENAVWEKAQALARALAGGDETGIEPMRAQTLETGRDVHGDPKLILVEADLCWRPFLIDAVLLWRLDAFGELPASPPRILAVYLDAARRSAALDFAGNDRDAAILDEIQEGWRDDVSLAPTTAAPGRLQAEVDDETVADGQENPIDALADALLWSVLGGNRPVQRWRVTFNQPFRFRDGVIEPSRGAVPVVAGPQEAAYFLGTPQSILVPQDIEEATDAAIRSYDIPLGDAGPEFFALTPRQAYPLRLPLRALRVHLFPEATGLIEWTVGDDAGAWEMVDGALRPVERSGDAPPIDHWRDLFGGGRASKIGDLGGRRIPMTMALLLDITHTLRFVRSTLKEGVWGDGADTHSLTVLRWPGLGTARVARGRDVDRDRIAGWFALLLKAAYRNVAIQPLSNEGGQVIVSAVAAGARPGLKTGQERLAPLVQRLATVDSYGENMAYDPDYAREEYEKAAYRRFESWGSLYAVTSHSFTYLGFGGFGLNVAHHLHMPTLYRRLFLIRQAYEAALSALSHQGAEATGLIAKPDANGEGERRYEALRRDLMLFTDVQWYRTVTSQVQGKELFDRMCENSPIDREFQTVLDSIARTDAYLAEHRREAEEKRERGLNMLVLAAGFVGVPFLVMSALLDPQKGSAFRTAFEWLVAKLPLGQTFTALFVGVAVVGTLWGGFEWASRRRGRGIDGRFAFWMALALCAFMAIFGRTLWSFITQ